MKNVPKKSMIAQVREEMETFLVGWNMTRDNVLMVVEFPDPRSSTYSFTLRPHSMFFNGLLDFQFTRPNGGLFFNCNSGIVGDENIEWLKERYKLFAEGVRTPCMDLSLTAQSGIRQTRYDYDSKYLFKLNGPKDVYDILVKIQALYDPPYNSV